MSVADSPMTASALKPNNMDRLNANSIKPVVMAIKKSAARQVIKHGKSGKLQDLINFVMLGISHKDAVADLDKYYAKGEEAFKFCLEHGHLPDGYEISSE